ncbi:uncharacterized protein (TIGR04141 family) [Nocardioides luteus]|uniref:TIGR04141 family sporadically distributed protein n=1 Tax=Nocardioides luteus TaxID=1844 RepID=A0ABQ5SQN6_9ACTN|nr:DUF6119 family protein [Nocardioides luteus]MDR7313021.1 uncharacterized protein (TIGR04141 family) [Nocardioides luteus]GGR44613.1 hypothetical protein GCM10010197_07800 [Nocardioides luteus]GLJ66081.1 hypothetical protein GCM10017579_01170 [Nocardioides luteus]
MTERAQAGRRTTIYRLTGVENFEQAIRSKYRLDERFDLVTVNVGARSGLLVTGSMFKEKAEWCEAVSVLTETDIAVNSVTPVGILIVRPSSESSKATGDADVAYALTYGMGFQLLDQGRLDNLFGQKIAIRTAEPNKLRSLTVTTMDERSRTSRATIAQGDGLLGFGLGDVGEAVSRVVAIANLPSLSRSDGKPFQIRGADALNVPLGRTPAEVISDLDALETLLAKKPPEALKLLEQLTAVKNPDVKDRLDVVLAKALNEAVADGSPGAIGLSWPHERVDENGTPDAWLPVALWPGRRRKEVKPGQPEWSEILEALEQWPPGDRLARLDRSAIQLFRDAGGESAISSAIPLRRWIAYQAEMDGHTFALYDGAWFQIHHDYAKNIKRRTAAIFARKVEDLDFIPWLEKDDEDKYNKKLAKALGGVCLDKKLITTELHRRGIEACDVYLPDGTLIHVKEVGRSTAASHLIAQALVSADALCKDEKARDKVRARITEAAGDPVGIGLKPKRVILAMHRRNGRPFTADDLFTFTMVNLVRHVEALEGRSVPVRIVSIDGEAHQ